MPNIHFRIAVCLCIAWGARLHAAVTLPGIINSGMVIQRDRQVPIWGWADAGEKITIMVGDKTVGTVTAEAGKPWKLMLPARPAGPVPPIRISGSNTITLINVLAGEVWLCSGQSNMAMSINKIPENPDGGVDNADQEVASANYPDIRCFTALRTTVGPHADGTTAWQVCSPVTAGSFSAAAYFFARDLYVKLKVPVGIVVAAWGGSSAEPWTPPTAARDPVVLAAVNQGFRDEYEHRVKEYKRNLEEWPKTVDRAKAAGAKIPDEPKPPREPETPEFGSCYKTQIEPLIPFAIRGAIWYQGESNTARFRGYPDIMGALIEGWRSAWGQGDFPFIQMQLASGGDESWCWLRETQATIAHTVPVCCLATVHDTGGGLLHPRNKQAAGLRFSLCAQRLAYGMDVDCTGPIPGKVRFENDSAVVPFTNTGGGLVAKGGTVWGFRLTGDDHVFHETTARIEGDTVIIQSKQVPKPVALRYGWFTWDSTLYGGTGLPVFPFRSDDWPPSW